MARNRPRNPAALIGLPNASAPEAAPPKLTAEESVAKTIAVCKAAQVQPLPTADTLPGTVEDLIKQILANQLELSHLRALLKQRL